MIKKFSEIIKNLDSKIKKILINGLYFSFAVSILASLFLLYYISFDTSNLTYYIGIEIMQLAISFAVYFFVSAIAFDRIQHELL